MIHDLKPYPAMKDSGVPWLGQVPEHWDVTRSKWLFSSSKALALPDDVQLSATQAYGVIPQDEYERRSGARVVKISMHLDKRKHVEKDDFIISMRSFQGGLERAWASGAIRSSYVVLKPGPGVNVGCFSYLLKSHDYIRALQTTGGFIRDGQDLTESDFRKVDLPLIPLAEQAAIVRFLDHADRRIRRTIAAKQRLIKLLQEQKQVIIHQAVTRGLDPDVKLKPSGVEWLGDVPEGWDITKLGSVFKERGEQNTKLLIKEVLSLTKDRGVILYAEKGNIGNKSSEDISRYKIVKPNDIVMNSMNVIIGSVGMSKYVGCLSPVYYVLTERNQDTVPEYFHYFFQSRLVQRSLTRIGNGILAHRMRIPMELLKSELILYPPIREQRQISLFLEDKLQSIDFTIGKAAREMTLLHEYRTSLIAEVVTGKMDVREAVALLPEVEAEPLPEDLELEDNDLEGEDAEAEADAGEMVEA